MVSCGDGPSGALPPKEYVPVLSKVLEKRLARIDALSLPALKKFALVSYTPYSCYEERAREKFPKLHARGALAVEKADPYDVCSVLARLRDVLTPSLFRSRKRCSIRRRYTPGR